MFSEESKNKMACHILKYTDPEDSPTHLCVKLKTKVEAVFSESPLYL